MRQGKERYRLCTSRRSSPYALLSFLIAMLVPAISLAEPTTGTDLLFLGNRNIAPVVYRDDGGPRGVAVDIVDAIAVYLSRPVEIRAMDWVEAQTLVALGEADALIQINPTDERKKTYDFSDDLLESRFSIFTSANGIGVSGIPSLRGLAVGVEAGGLPWQLLEKMPEIRLTIIPDFLEGFRLLIRAELDAIVVDHRVGTYIIAKNKLRGIRVSGEPIAHSWSALAVKKGNAELLGEINAALRTIKADGTYQKILDRWEPKEVVFLTRQQISRVLYLAGTLVLLILVSIMTVWTAILRKELALRKRAEKKLIQSESAFRGVVENSPNYIIRYDRECRAIYGNDKIKTILEDFDTRILDKTPLEAQPNGLYEGGLEEIENYQDGLRQVLVSGQARNIELRVPDASGALRVHGIILAPERDEEGKVVAALAFGWDITEDRKREQERQENLRFFETMDRVNRSIQGADDIDGMAGEVLDIVLSTFGCDRAFLMYPCDPHAATWRVPIERNTPEYPGVGVQNIEITMEEEVAATCRVLLDCDRPVQYGSGTGHPLPGGVSERFGLKSYMALALRPKEDKPWQFGVHQCSYARSWTAEEERLLMAIGLRLEDGLDRLLAHRRLQESEAWTRTLIQAIPDLVWSKDFDGAYMSCNAAFASLLGADEARIIGKTDYDFMNAELADSFRDNDRRAMAAVGPSVNEEWLASATEGYRGLFETIKTPLRDTHGKTIGILGIARDITERKWTEDALRDLNRQLRAISDCNQILLRAEDEWTLLDGFCHSVCEEAGYSLAWVGYAENDVDRSIRPVAWAGYNVGYIKDAKLTWADGDERGQAPAGIAIRTGEMCYSQDFSTDPKMALWQESAFYRGYRSGIALPLKDEGGKAFGSLNIYSGEPHAFPPDEIRLLEELSNNLAYGITFLRARIERGLAEREIRRLNAELERRVALRTAELESANKELEAFSYSVAHDLRAPLRHINGYVDLLTSCCRDSLPEKGSHYLDTIADSAHRMGLLIDDLLRFSRTGRVEMHREIVDMNRALEDALALLRPGHQGRTIEWAIAELPTVNGDYALLRQVWANLLENAIKYTGKREDARIEVGFREKDGEIIFTVSDNGVGFDMRYAGKLFGIFQRLHSEEEFEGNGIGLATVQRIISRHDGRVWAEAELNQGASFHFTLPGYKETINVGI